MNVYSHAKHAFDERAIRMGELYAVPAAVTVQNAKDLAQTRRLASQLQVALGSRSVIDQALGMVMSRAGCGPEEAFERLKALSQCEHRKLSEVARHLVGQVATRSPARHSAAQLARMPPRRGSAGTRLRDYRLPRRVSPRAYLRDRLGPVPWISGRRRRLGRQACGPAEGARPRRTG